MKFCMGGSVEFLYAGIMTERQFWWDQNYSNKLLRR